MNENETPEGKPFAVSDALEENSKWGYVYHSRLWFYYPTVSDTTLYLKCHTVEN
jgi:hypothetical protein